MRATRPDAPGRAALALVPALVLALALVYLAACTWEAVPPATATLPATDTPRAQARVTRVAPSPIPSPTPTATPTPPPTDTSTPSATPVPPTPTPIPPTPTATSFFSDSRFGVGGGWGCNPNPSAPYIRLGARYVFAWQYRTKPAGIGMPRGSIMVRSVPSLICSGYDDQGRCTGNRVFTIADTAVSPTLTDTVRSAGPGGYWSLGNEVNTTGSMQMMGSEAGYAVWFHDMATIIKRNDPRAVILSAGLLSVMPGTNRGVPMGEFAQGFLDAYQSLYGQRAPVDVWNIHVYEEVNHTPDIILNEFNTWRQAAGEANRPLWVTEFSYIATDATVEKEIDYMHRAVRAFEAAGVARWFWFIGHEPRIGLPFGLWECDGTLTAVGDEYRKLARHVIAP